MAIHANSTPAPERTVLRDAAAPGRLLPAFNPDLDRGAELLAILDAGPIGPEALAGLSRQRQLRVEAGIAMLIDYLDAIYFDSDLEDDGCAEPWLGSIGSCSTAGSSDQGRWACGGSDDREQEDEDGDDLDHGEDEHDGLEPSLGAAIVGSLHQTLWSRGTHADLEEECEDEGADTGDREPSLGAPENDMHYRWGWGGIVDRKCDQTRWASGGCNDGERGEDDEPALGWPEEHHLQGQAGRVAGLGSEEGDFDEVRPPGAGSAVWYERRRAARADAEALLVRRCLGSFRSDNLVPIAPGRMLLTRVA